MHATDPWRFSQVSYAVASMSRFVVIAVAWLAACGDKQLDEVTSIKNEVCACKDVACGEAAMKKMPKGELETSHKMQRAANDMLDCMARLYEKTRPTTDPDAEAPEATSGSAAPASAETP
jgi:hypothetical protein